jgi:hypothetical protein
MERVRGRVWTPMRTILVEGRLHSLGDALVVGLEVLCSGRYV